MLQSVIFKCLRSITQCYSAGIKECIKKGVQYFFIPEDIFTFGKPLISNLIDFKITARIADEFITPEVSHFLLDNNQSFAKMSQKELLN